MNSSTKQLPYVLITPARNESAFIEKTIQSVINQTVLPLKWVIVDDGSLDDTASIVKKYLPSHDWMELVELPKHRERNFAGKVYAFNVGLEKVKDVQYDIIGNLDADISFEETHFEFLLTKFSEDDNLGVAGTVFEEEGGYSSATHSFEGQDIVAGQCQIFRRQCFLDIGGYKPHKAGGIDWMAVTTARMMGWTTRQFREKAFFHYRHLGTAERGRLAAAFSYGEKDYYLGGHPLWEMFRTAYRATQKPYVVGGLALGAGYCWAFLRRAKRPVSPELMRFHRQEQMLKLKTIVKTLLTFKRLDKFELSAKQKGRSKIIEDI